MLFGDRLKELRLEKNITQKDLSALINVSDRVIGYYESNDRFPKDEDILKKLANIFDVSTDYLLGNTDIKKPAPDKSVLTKKDQQEIDEYISEFEQGMLANGGLMLNGEPLSEESKEKIIAAMRVGAELAKQQAKEKFTPKKYRG